MKIVKTVKEIQALAGFLRREGKTLSLVPTMGFFHEGHLSLFRKGREAGDVLVVSIFVNPAQFGAGEDFDAYPRNVDRDLQLARQETVDIVFLPDARELYSEGFQTYVTLTRLPGHLCGISRPEHFRGVATVVTKLFNIVGPRVAVFGQKDYQQLQIVRRMARDLNLDIDIVGMPTVREPDGLAMSSRNSLLSRSQRESALSLHRSLTAAQRLVTSGTIDSSKVIAAAAGRIAACPETAVDYIAVCDPETLEDMARIDRPALMALAVRVGKTRLIDNMILYPSPANEGEIP